MNSADSTPNPKELRSFGLVFSIILLVLFGLVIPLIRFGFPNGLPFMTDGEGPIWPWLVAAVVTALALLLPKSLIWLYRPWMKFAHIAQWVNTRIIMFVLFYFVILPIGLVRKLLRKDSMQRKFDPAANTYRTQLKEADQNDMSKPF